MKLATFVALVGAASAQSAQSYNSEISDVVSAQIARMGIDVEKPDSNNGKVSITYDWKT